jgi:uncharacterized protein YbcI
MAELEGPRPTLRSEGRQPSAAGLLNAALARAVVEVCLKYLGRGPTRAQAFFRNNYVVVILEDTRTTAEQSLVDGGNADSVLRVRGQIRKAMHGDLVEWVERLTGGTVTALLGANHVTPDVAAEVFVLDRVVQMGSASRLA